MRRAVMNNPQALDERPRVRWSAQRHGVADRVLLIFAGCLACTAGAFPGPTMGVLAVVLLLIAVARRPWVGLAVLLGAIAFAGSGLSFGAIGLQMRVIDVVAIAVVVA